MNKNKIVLYVLMTCLLLIAVGIILVKELSGERNAAVSEDNNVNISREKGAKKERTDRKARLQARKKRLCSKKRSINKFKESKGLVEVDTVSDQISRLDSAQDKIDLLDQLWEVDDPALPKLVLEQLDDKNEDVRFAAIELLDNKSEGEILCCIDKALDDPDKRIREFAVILLADSNETQTTQTLLLKGVDDSTEDVRAAALDVLGDKGVKEQEFVYNQSIASPYSDVKNTTLDLLIDIPSHRVVPMIFRGLNDDDKDFREMVQTKIHFLFSKEFENYNDAMDWWEKNKDKYDEELFEK